MNEPEFWKWIGRTVRAKRKELEMSQTELAKAIGIARGDKLISAIERGRSRPPRARLQALEATLKLPRGYLKDRIKHFEATAGLEVPPLDRFLGDPGGAGGSHLTLAGGGLPKTALPGDLAPGWSLADQVANQVSVAIQRFAEVALKDALQTVELRARR